MSLFKQEFNKEEAALAVVYGIAPLSIIGWWALIPALLCWIPWCLGGAGYGRVWRYAGCPALLSGAFLAAGRPWWEVLGAALTLLVFLPGYGIPDPPDRRDRDEGSTLGQFWYKIVTKWFGGYSPGNWNEIEMVTTFMVRGTLAAGFALMYTPCVVSAGFLRVCGVDAILLVGMVCAVALYEGTFKI